jgi:spore germination protein GerM
MKQKKFLIIIAVLVVLIALYFILRSTPAGKILRNNTNNKLTEQKLFFDPLNATYTIEGQQFVFKNGKAEKEIPGSSAKIEIRNFDTPFYGDLNGDGIDDAAFTLFYTAGGSGIFYYVVAAMNIDDKAIGTNAILLGDRIAPQNTLIENQIILANYADRKPGEPMTEDPSVGTTKRIFWDGNKLTEKTGN